MEYEEFRKKVKEFAKKAKTQIRYENRGAYFIARSDGVTIQGGPLSEDITVSWGSANEGQRWLYPRQYRGNHRATISCKEAAHG